jgi:aldose sugar dehydrogenase
MRKSLLLVSAFFTINAYAQMTVTVGTTTLDVDTVYYGTGSGGAFTGTNGMDIPWEMIYGPDDHLWITERKGLVSRINPVTKTKTIVLNIISNVYQQSESGLLGMVLHPDFETTPEVFMAYTYGTFSNIKEKVVKYTFNGTSLVNEVILIDNIIGNTTHNGSRMAILPDNTLLFSTGDAQNTALPQDTDELNGKILRVNLDGTIPADNPIAANPVFSWGHRNVQGMLLHPNGKVYLSEHGASTDDEFQILEIGRNYGWPNVEGFCDPGGEETFCNANNVVEPLVAWTPTIAPSDLVYYENPLIPEWDGRVLMSVLKDKKLIAMQLNTDGTAVIDEDHYLTNTFGRLRDICVGPDNEIYLATNGASWSNTNPNTHQIIVLRTQDNSSVIENQLGKVKIYPNPVGNEFSLEVEDKLIGQTYLITDLSGRIVLNGTISSLTQKIDAQGLKKGIYELIIQDQNGKTISKKLVK